MVIGEHGEITRLESFCGASRLKRGIRIHGRVVDIPVESLLIVAIDGSFDEQVWGFTFDSLHASSAKVRRGR